MNTFLRAAVVVGAVCFLSGEATAADEYDALLAHIDYLEREEAVWGALVDAMDLGDFDALQDAGTVGVNYATAMAPPPPYDDGSVETAVTDALGTMSVAVVSLDAAMRGRLDACIAAQAGLDYESNGQHDEAVAAFQSAAYNDLMGFDMFIMDLLSLSDAVDNANYWLANWPEDPGGMMP